MRMNDPVAGEFLDHIKPEGSVDGLNGFLLKCSAEERASLAPLIKKHAVPMMNDAISFHEGRLQEKRTASQNQRGLLAILACGTLADAKHVTRRAFQEMDKEKFVHFLRKVRPPWLQDWVEWLAEQNFHRSYIEPMVNAGLAEAPRHQNYLLGLLAWFAVGNAYEAFPKIPHMLERDIWRFFEIEGDQERSLANRGRYEDSRLEKDASIPWALRKWSEEGRLSRGRLLDASLESLSRDFIQYRAGWYSRFHEYMEPTLEERVSRTDAYLGLLGSSIPPTVSFALKALQEIDQAGKLSPQALAERLGPALQAKSKGTVKTALQLLGSAAKRHPEWRSRLLARAADAFVSESPEVHEAAVKLLAAYRDDLDAAVKEAVAPYLDAVTPSVRAALAKLLPVGPAMPKTKPPVNNGSPGPVEVLSLLDESRRIEPIRDLDEWLAQAAFILENPGEVMAIERVLDGMIRFYADPAKAGHPALPPLVKRATDLLKPMEKERRSSHEAWDVLTWATLILRWAGAERIPAASRYQLEGIPIAPSEGGDASHLQARLDASRTHYEPYTVFWGRAVGVALLFAKRSGLPLLSTPTHERFWIEPAELVRRSLLWQEARQDPDHLDQFAALLRLAPEGRRESLAQAADVKGEWGQVLCFALGGEGIAPKDAALWRAAQSVRPDAPSPSYEWSYELETWTGYDGQGHSQRAFQWKCLDPTVEPMVHDSRSRFEDRTVALGFLYDGKGERSSRWLLALWPTGRDPISALGVILLGKELHAGEVSGQRAFALLEALADPAEPLGEYARDLLNLGLFCAYPEGRALAAHALTTRLAAGAVDIPQLAQSQLKFMRTGMIFIGRLRRSLDDVVLAGPRHANAVVDYLLQLLHADPAHAPKDMGKLFELLYEQLVALGRKIEDPQSLAYLRAFFGKGRAGTLAQRLGKLT